jgi:hypothetical protein
VICMSSKAPSVAWTTATVPKAGNSPDENEDAAATSQDGLRFAVADGATEGWESGSWAKQIAATYVVSPPSAVIFPEWLAVVRQEWVQPELPDPVAWYVEEKRSQGSFATLIGLELKHSKSMTRWAWRTVAIGDSCLFHIRSGQIKVAFPLSNPKEFGDRPSLIPSSPTFHCPGLTSRIGRAAPGDFLLLATDAVAANLLALPDPTAWDPVLTAVRDSLRTGDQAPLVACLLAFQAKKNDDMTLIAISLPEIPEQHS